MDSEEEEVVVGSEAAELVEALLVAVEDQEVEEASLVRAQAEVHGGQEHRSATIHTAVEYITTTAQVVAIL